MCVIAAHVRVLLFLQCTLKVLSYITYTRCTRTVHVLYVVYYVACLLLVITCRAYVYSCPRTVGHMFSPDGLELSLFVRVRVQ